MIYILLLTTNKMYSSQKHNNTN